MPNINADSEALSEAIINLIDNAAKYSNETKEIMLKTYQKNHNVILEVTDKGIGISKDDKEKIFDKFFRVSTGLVHNTKGTGLGLTIVKHVLDAHNAQIELDSKVNEGSTFRIIFNSVKT
ncbi:two-component system sensor histidine kinase [hydrocarbon metagenome]|uniref:histidine kinase n=1 Tax=hydrocarbon metagenome TaxID=938273 RepID=A0A0W8G0A8_9ZZZZ